MAAHWAAVGAAICVPLPSSCQKWASQAQQFIKITGIEPRAAPQCWEMFTCTSQGASSSTPPGHEEWSGSERWDGFTKEKQHFGANSVLHDPACSSPGAGAGYRMWSLCHPRRRRSKLDTGPLKQKKEELFPLCFQ